MKPTDTNDAPPAIPPEPTDANLQKMVAVGELLAGVSHESRNILTAILSFAQVGQRRQHDPAKMAEILKLIETEAQRCIHLHATLLAQISTTATQGMLSSPQLRDINLSEVIVSSSRLVQHQMGMKRLALVCPEPSSEWRVHADPSSLGQVFLNLLLNAMQATPEGGTVRISIVREDQGLVCVSFDDSGPGVPAEHRERIFERKFTTKPMGTGLGLAVSQDILHAIDGTLAVGESELGGASLQVRLPALQNPEEAP